MYLIIINLISLQVLPILIQNIYLRNPTELQQTPTTVNITKNLYILNALFSLIFFRLIILIIDISANMLSVSVVSNNCVKSRDTTLTVRLHKTQPRRQCRRQALMDSFILGHCILIIIRKIDSNKSYSLLFIFIIETSCAYRLHSSFLRSLRNSIPP